jgi:molybdopterin-guanine dinucleotide biosynthesis protein A
MEKLPEITGIILAGGKNTRMGQYKALVEWRGKSLINWVLDAISPLCSEIIVSSNDKVPVNPEVLIVPDRFTDIGPAAGIESGLYHSKTNLNIIVSCDTPMVNTDFFRYMIDNHGDFEISIPIHDGINEPMIGIYNKSVQAKFEEAILRGQARPPSIIRSCRFQEILVSNDLNFYNDNLFLNLNSPDDLKEF